MYVSYEEDILKINRLKIIGLNQCKSSLQADARSFILNWLKRLKFSLDILIY